MMKKIAGWIAIEEFGSRPARNRRLEFFFFSKFFLLQMLFIFFNSIYKFDAGRDSKPSRAHR